MLNETVIRFDKVNFEYNGSKPILEEVSFNVRTWSKITIMWQNWAWKSTIFKLIIGVLKPTKWSVIVDKGLSVATAFQIVKPQDKHLTVQKYFLKYYNKPTEYNIDKKILDALNVVNLNIPLDVGVGSLSWWQQAKILLAAALIQNPDILLLDEPTNNLDREAIAHLTNFLINYKKTCIVISHDADFLNSFTDWVLYLDVFTKKIEQYVWDYYDVVEQIKAKIEKDNMKNAQMAKQAEAKKKQAEIFAHKGWKLRLVAKKMREAASEMIDEMVDVRREDKTIRQFQIPVQKNTSGTILKLSSVNIVKNNKVVKKKVDIALWKNSKLLLSWPNWIWKTTLLESLASWHAVWEIVTKWVKIGYYRQDFWNLDFEEIVYDYLMRQAWNDIKEQDLRSVAAGFLITSDKIKSKIWHLSEWLKGLVAFCGLVFQAPGLLILDEPTNHINFRHIPIIAKALDDYKWAMILVSHVDEFVWQIKIDNYLELDNL